MNLRYFRNKYVIIIVLCFVIGLLSYTFFNISNSEKKVIGKSENGYRVDIEPITSRFPKLGELDKSYWKADTIGKTDFGPSSYWMKGFVIIKSKDLSIFKNQFKWISMAIGWKPTLDTNILKEQSLKWSYSEEFNKYIKSANYVGKFYLDLELGIIYFDVQK